MNTTKKMENPNPRVLTNAKGEEVMTAAQFEAKARTQAAEKAQIVAKNKAKEGIHDFLEFTVSGSYLNSSEAIIDFDNLKIRVPMCDEDVGIMNVRRRYINKAIKQATKANGEPMYPEHIKSVRQVFDDNVRSIKGTLSFYGKNIKTLSIDEMQDLATSKDLRFIPLPNSGLSKREMLVNTYVAYSDKILGIKVKYQDGDFSFAKLPDIIIDASGRTESSGKITNEEIIAQEQKSVVTVLGERDKPENRFTMQELKTLADQKNIQYTDNVQFKDLYSELFNV